MPVCSLAWPAASRGRRAGSRTNFQTIAAISSPGMAARYMAPCHPNACAIGTRMMGARKEPSSALPAVWTTPMWLPRSSSVACSATRDWLIGRMGPSEIPISRRAASSVANETARPDSTEQSENVTMQINSGTLREPVRSEMTPPNSPASAHVSARPDESSPTCVKLRRRSAAMKGVRKLAALRSKNTTPNVRLSSSVNRHWYCLSMT